MRLIVVLMTCAWMMVISMLASAHDGAMPENLSDLSMHKLGQKIYVVHGLQQLPNSSNQGFISNTGVILTDAGVVVVDSGGSLQVGRLILARIRELTDKPVIAVFNTHMHGDHWLGNVAFREAFPGVPIYAHEIAIDHLKNGQADRWLDIFMNMTDKSVAGTRNVLPDHKLTGGEKLKIGGMNFNVHHTGHAHTDSDVMIELPGSRVLFTGDIVEYGRLVSSDVPQDFNAQGQISAIEYALEMPVDIYVPGHGTSGKGEIPRAALRFLKILYGSVKLLYEEGLQDYEMRDQVAEALSEFSGWYNFDQLGRMISFVILQVEAAEFQ